MTVRWVTVGPLGTQCYLVWEDPAHAVVIDPGDEALRILEAVKANGLTVDAVLLTHAHFDHMLAAEAVCAHTGAPLLVGAGDADALLDPNRNLSGWFSPGAEVTIEKAALLHESDTVCFGDESLEVMETPGHTPGCICLYTDSVRVVGGLNKCCQRRCVFRKPSCRVPFGWLLFSGNSWFLYPPEKGSLSSYSGELVE